MDNVRSLPAVRDYTLLGIVSLAFLALLLYIDGFGGWALLPILPGLLSLLTFSVFGPPAVLGLMTFILMMGNRLKGFPPWYRAPTSELTDVMLAGAMLVYIACHWRLLSIVKQALPSDARRARKPKRHRLLGRWMIPGEASKRTPERVPPRDLLVPVAQCILFAAVGYLLYFRLSVETAPPDLRMPDRVWQVLVVVWVMGMTLIGGYTVMTVMRWLTSSRDEGLMYLQDQLWTETRGEQRRIQRWMTQAKLDDERREQ